MKGPIKAMKQQRHAVGSAFEKNPKIFSCELRQRQEQRKLKIGLL